MSLGVRTTGILLQRLRVSPCLTDRLHPSSVGWESWTTPDGVKHRANWPKTPDTSGNVVNAVTTLARRLAHANIRVGIVAPESSNADDGPGLAEVEACKSSAECWSDLTAIASHSYGMGATSAWANATASTDGRIGGAKGYWVTEAGAFGTTAHNGSWQGTLLACRFLNDLNHGVDTWLAFLGACHYDPNVLAKQPRGESEEMGTKLIRTYPRADQPGPGGIKFEIMPEYWCE